MFGRCRAGTHGVRRVPAASTAQPVTSSMTATRNACENAVVCQHLRPAALHQYMKAEHRRNGFDQWRRFERARSASPAGLVEPLPVVALDNHRPAGHPKAYGYTLLYLFADPAPFLFQPLIMRCPYRRKAARVFRPHRLPLPTPICFRFWPIARRNAPWSSL